MYLIFDSCQATALPSEPKQPDKLDSDTQSGIFLSFSRTGKNAIYYNIKTKEPKITADIAYNEAEVSLSSISPNFQTLQNK